MNLRNLSIESYTLPLTDDLALDIFQQILGNIIYMQNVITFVYVLLLLAIFYHKDLTLQL